MLKKRKLKTGAGQVWRLQVGPEELAGQGVMRLAGQPGLAITVEVEDLGLSAAQL